MKCEVLLPCVCVCVYVCLCATRSDFPSQFYGFCTQIPFFNFGRGVYCAEWENAFFLLRNEKQIAVQVIKLKTCKQIISLL